MDLATLKSEICSYAENYEADFVARLPSFIRQAESRIYNTVTIPALRKTALSTIGLANPFLRLPSDYLAAFSVAVKTVDCGFQYLLNKDINFIREAYPYPGVAGVPTHYAQYDDTALFLGPTPATDFMVELNYFYRPDSIVDGDDTGTTWLSINFPTALIYGALLEAASFMKSEKDTVDMYKDRYTEAMNLLVDLGDGKMRRDAYRSGQQRLPVRGVK